MSMTMNNPGRGPDLTEGVPLRRFWAWCIDLLLVAVIATVLYVLLFVLGILTLGLGFGLMALLPVVPLAYHTLFVASARAATPGQALLGLRVVRDQDLGRPELGQAIVFTLGLWLTLSIAFVLLGIALFTDRNRTLHDMASGLVVARIEALTRGAGFANIAPGMPHA